MTNEITLDAYNTKLDKDEEELSIDFVDESGKKLTVKMSTEQAEEFVMELYQILGLDAVGIDED